MLFRGSFGKPKYLFHKKQFLYCRVQENLKLCYMLQKEQCSMYLLYPLMYIPLLLKFFFCTRYDLRQLLVVLAFYIFTMAAILPSYEQDIFSLFSFIAAFKDINWRKALACFAAFTAAMAAVPAGALLFADFLPELGIKIRTCLTAFLTLLSIFPQKSRDDRPGFRP